MNSLAIMYHISIYVSIYVAKLNPMQCRIILTQKEKKEETILLTVIRDSVIVIVIIHSIGQTIAIRVIVSW